MSRNRNRRTVELEFTIPFSDGSEDSDDAEMTCYICANGFCGSGACSRTSTSLKCCTQPICCACVAKTAKRCGCADDCEQIVAHCPFCRDISPLTSKDVFLGLKAIVCKGCVRADSVPTATRAVPVGQATVFGSAATVFGSAATVFGSAVELSSSLPIQAAQPSQEGHGSIRDTQDTLSRSA